MHHGGAWIDGCGVGEGRSMTVSVPWRIRWYREVQGPGAVGDIHGMSRTGQVEKVRCSGRSIPRGPWAGPCQGRTSGGGGGQRVGEVAAACSGAAGVGAIPQVDKSGEGHGATAEGRQVFHEKVVRQPTGDSGYTKPPWGKSNIVHVRVRRANRASYTQPPRRKPSGVQESTSTGAMGASG